MDSDLHITLGNGRRCPLVVHYWADLQSVHGFRCYGNIRAKCEMSSRAPVYSAAGLVVTSSFQSGDQRTTPECCEAESVCRAKFLGGSGAWFGAHGRGLGVGRPLPRSDQTLQFDHGGSVMFSACTGHELTGTDIWSPAAAAGSPPTGRARGVRLLYTRLHAYKIHKHVQN